MLTANEVFRGLSLHVLQPEAIALNAELGDPRLDATAPARGRRSSA
jgi:hypothetical protein